MSPDCARRRLARDHRVANRNRHRSWRSVSLSSRMCLWTPSHIYARKRLASPPTKLPTFFFGIVLTRIWVDPKHNVHLVARDFHPLDQRPKEVPFAHPIGGLQSVVEFGGTVLQPANNQLQCALQGGLIRQRLALLLP